MESLSENSQTEYKFYILGDKRVFNTRAPHFFSEIMKKAGVFGTYEPYMIKPGKIGETMRELKGLNISGANVTIPYKETIIPHLDELSEGAVIIGSINTIVRKGDFFKGYNTNAIGFMDALKGAGFDATGKSALVFGTGGAARAVVFILNWVKAKPILIAGRSYEKISPIVNKIGGEAIFQRDIADRPCSADIVINATSASSPEESPELADIVSRLQLPNCELVVDLNYGRTNNFWENMAKSKGIRFMDGISSLANQAKRTIGLWTGIDVSQELILSVIKE